MVQVTNSDHFKMKMPRKYGGCCLNASWRHMSRMLAVGWNRTRSQYEKSNSWLDIGPRGGKKYRKSVEVLEASTGIEPVYTDLQSAASPLRQLAFSSKIKYLPWCAWGFSSFPKGRPEDCAQFCRRDGNLPKPATANAQARGVASTGPLLGVSGCGKSRVTLGMTREIL